MYKSLRRWWIFLQLSDEAKCTVSVQMLWIWIAGVIWRNEIGCWTRAGYSSKLSTGGMKFLDNAKNQDGHLRLLCVFVIYRYYQSNWGVHFWGIARPTEIIDEFAKNEK